MVKCKGCQRSWPMSLDGDLRELVKLMWHVEQDHGVGLYAQVRNYARSLLVNEYEESVFDK